MVMSRFAFPESMRIPFILVLAFIIPAFLITPVSALVTVTSESYTPPAPLVPGSADTAVVTLAVIPSGATTFPRTHSLQMQTALVDTQWNIQVYVNGVAAAHQTGTGSAEFMNGYLLSYPTTSDVTMTVTISGSVPSASAANVTILQVNEIDTTGGSVPYGSITVAAPLVSSVTTSVPLGTTPASSVAETPVSTKSGNDAVMAGIVLSGIILAAFGYSRIRR